jgi:hypothetical protein
MNRTSVFKGCREFKTVVRLWVMIRGAEYIKLTDKIVENIEGDFFVHLNIFVTYKKSSTLTFWTRYIQLWNIYTEIDKSCLIGRDEISKKRGRVIKYLIKTNNKRNSKE